MIYLVLSVLCTAAFILLFKYFERFDIKVFQAIVFNYWVAFACGVVDVPESLSKQTLHTPWFSFALLLGLCFITIFTCTGKTVKLFSVSTASLAMKLGLVFPVIFAFLLYGEDFNVMKLIGILFAFAAVILVSYHRTGEHHRHTKFELMLPFIVFAGSGLCDSGVQYANKELLHNDDVAPFVTINFLSAAAAGSCVLLFQMLRGQAKFEWKNVFGGIALGIPNYFSFVFMLKALETMSWGSSVVFPVSNLATIMCSALGALILFKEKISKANLAGLTLAAFSIILIILSNTS